MYACFYFTYRPTNKINVLAAVYVEQTFMLNMICNMYYYQNLKKKKHLPISM